MNGSFVYSLLTSLASLFEYFGITCKCWVSTNALHKKKVCSNVLNKTWMLNMPTKSRIQLYPTFHIHSTCQLITINGNTADTSKIDTNKYAILNAVEKNSGIQRIIPVTDKLNYSFCIVIAQRAFRLLFQSYIFSATLQFCMCACVCTHACDVILTSDLARLVVSART